MAPSKSGNSKEGQHRIQQAYSVLSRALNSLLCRGSFRGSKKTSSMGPTTRARPPQHDEKATSDSSSLHWITSTGADGDDIDDKVKSHNWTLFVYRTWERRIIVKYHTVIKRHTSEDEFCPRPDGTVIYPIWAHERLRNEAATLTFLADKTSIPVPKCRLYYGKNGVLHLETTRIKNGISLEYIDRDMMPAALAAVNMQIQKHILPQLRSLKRNYIGSVDMNIPVFPPQRVHHADRRLWDRVTSDTDEFVFCHNDLGPQNIFVDPDDNFRIVGIIDWEYAGFFPSYFELPLWKAVDDEAVCKLYEDEEERELAFFGLERDDLNDNRMDLPPVGWGAKA